MLIYYPMFAWMKIVFEELETEIIFSGTLDRSVLSTCSVSTINGESLDISVLF